MVKVVISDHNRNQLVQLQYAANVTWRKALNSQGFASFDLPLSDPYATPTYLSPRNYVHIYPDNVDSTNFANADWGGQLVNDYELKPKEGIITMAAAGLANLLETSIVSNTVTFTGIDAGTAIEQLLTTWTDNWGGLGLTPASVYYGGPPLRKGVWGLGYPAVDNGVFGFGDIVLEDIYKVCEGYGIDFEVRPDFTYAIYARQGVDNLNLVARYGPQGNVQVESTMKLVNTEMANQVWYIDNSGTTVYTASQTSVQYYGPKTVVFQDDNTFSAFDALTKAQLYAVKSAFPLYLMDNITVVDTPLLPFSQIHLGDKILFEAPSLPMLQSFQGPQRILAVEYNDRKRTMTLTLGNALYKIVRGQLHEVRLYQ